MEPEAWAQCQTIMELTPARTGNTSCLLHYVTDAVTVLLECVGKTRHSKVNYETLLIQYHKQQCIACFCSGYPSHPRIEQKWYPKWNCKSSVTLGSGY